MFTCSRCGTSFNATIAATAENCPRCRARDGVESPLVFKLFRSPAGVGAEKPTDRVAEREVEAAT